VAPCLDHTRSPPTRTDRSFVRHTVAPTPLTARRHLSSAVRRGLASFRPPAALAEGFLREELIMGAVLFSVIVIVIGATSGDLVWAVVCIAAGIFGTVLVLFAVARHWAFKDTGHSKTLGIQRHWAFKDTGHSAGSGLRLSACSCSSAC
jgi:hypothetical protein